MNCHTAALVKCPHTEEIKILLPEGTTLHLAVTDVHVTNEER